VGGGELPPLGGYAFAGPARGPHLWHGIPVTNSPFVSLMVDFVAGEGWLQRVRSL